MGTLETTYEVSLETAKELVKKGFTLTRTHLLRVFGTSSRSAEKFRHIYEVDYVDRIIYDTIISKSAFTITLPLEDAINMMVIKSQEARETYALQIEPK